MFVLVWTVVLSGCGGTKVLKEPLPIPTTQPLAIASDQRVTATLDWVIVRDGPGTWARNADWDEYLIRVSHHSDQPIQVVGVIVVDSLNTRIESQPGRKQRVKASKETARRYKESGIKVKAGLGAGALVTGVGIAGSGAAAVAVTEMIVTGGAAGVGAATAVVGLVVLGPVLVVGGIVRGANNSAVSDRIELRRTRLPLVVISGEELLLNVFFPIAPSPVIIEVMYTDGGGEKSLIFETSEALNGLHMDASTD